jgi:hypothetical protein
MQDTAAAPQEAFWRNLVAAAAAASADYCVASIISFQGHWLSGQA